MFGTYARNVIAGQGRYVPDVDSKVCEIPVIDLKLCDYRKEQKCLTLASELMGMPLTFKVRSHHTGRVVRFVPVNPADPLYDEDHWDGEQQIYRPVEKLPNVEYMVIYNQW